MGTCTMNDTQAVRLLYDMLNIESLSGAEGRHAAFLAERMIAIGYTKAYVDDAGNAVGEMGTADAPRTIMWTPKGRWPHLRQPWLA